MKNSPPRAESGKVIPFPQKQTGVTAEHRQQLKLMVADIINFIDDEGLLGIGRSVTAHLRAHEIRKTIAVFVK
jgi:hypothetical protein